MEVQEALDELEEYALCTVRERSYDEEADIIMVKAWAQKIREALDEHN